MFKIEKLGVNKFRSPLKEKLSCFTKDDECIYYNIDKNKKNNVSIEKAGPRENIFFDSKKVKTAIVTSGGLCPGLNDVIRSIYLGLFYRYGVKNVLGIRYGFSGFLKEKLDYIKLNHKIVESIHMDAGSILGSSRGKHDTKKILDKIIKEKINVLFCVGGDGTLKGAKEIHKEAKKRKYLLSVVGIPKTIDNDIMYTEKSFGFDTAVNKATDAISAVHTEAKGYNNGIGLLKLMGRDSGFIACSTALAVSDANFVLIPEVDFDIEGKNGLLSHLFKRLKQKKHAVIIVAEGAGQKHFDKKKLGTDRSGNQRLGDIGLFLKDKITEYAKKKNIEIYLKYIDPSYIIRSTPTVGSDGIFCIQLAQNAVHAAMAGKTNLSIAYMHGTFIHIPIKKAVSERKKVNPEKDLWINVLGATGQPQNMLNSK
jgi:6-phosphofructokinase 1